MVDFIFYLALIIAFIATLMFARRLVRFLLIIFFDETLTVRYMRKDGRVTSKKLRVRKEGDILDALDELREDSARGSV